MSNHQDPIPRVLLPLKPGSVRAEGWLRHQMQLQAEGLTGHTGEVFADVGPDSAWLGGSGEAWERGPYYVRGLVTLAWVLGDEVLQTEAMKWLDWTLGSQRDDGSFGPAQLNPVDWWPRMPMLHALQFYHDATGDGRVVPFLTTYFRFQYAHIAQNPLFQWATARAADNVMTVLWLYDKVKEPWLLDLARTLLEQSIDWVPVYRAQSFDQDYWTVHGVNVAEGLRNPAMRYRMGGNPDYLAGLDEGLRNLQAAHWQPEGLYSGDEYLAGMDPTRGTETCTVVEMILSCQVLLETTGNPRYADMLEKLVFNALPALFKPDLRAHQYYQTPNQVQCVVGEYEWYTKHDTLDENTFGVGVGYGCCISNLHMGWPFAAHGLWMRTPAGALAAVTYAPSHLSTQVNGQRIQIHQATDYPFDAAVSMLIDLDDRAAFGLMLRIPAWCDAPVVAVNGERLDAQPGAFLTIEREWSDGDVVEMHFPMSVALASWPRDAVSVERGPLVYALKIGEDWTQNHDYGAGFYRWEVRPTTPWNYALVLNPDRPERAFAFDKAASLPDQPWDGEEAPVWLTAEARRVPGWVVEQNVARNLPQSPVEEGNAPEPVTLIPYGAAKLRISVFPWRKT
ncbi:MAG: glycoside hydrolase family 127 protein [Anaerolineae bacterium]|nr:glycoside hydrolase family 127 protein [Anaerolineae bacterium]